MIERMSSQDIFRIKTLADLLAQYERECDMLDLDVKADLSMPYGHPFVDFDARIRCILRLFRQAAEIIDNIKYLG